MRTGGGPFHLHGGAVPWEPGMRFQVAGGQFHCELLVVQYALCYVGAEDGGLCVVPGSHKSNEPTPNEVRSVEDHRGLVEQPEMKAGDVLFFAETATHGTLPWTAEHERRSVLYKYTSRGAARAVGKYFTPKSRHGDWVTELPSEQQALLYGPGVHYSGRLPILESDGETTWIAD